MSLAITTINLSLLFIVHKPVVVKTKPLPKPVPIVVSIPVNPTPAVIPLTFDANNPTTWPHCEAGQIVWAQDGTCHDPAPSSVPVASTQATAPSVVNSCGDNMYAQYIYQHESGCDLNSVNSIGCRGIGQACPGDKLPCGADYACQNAFFTSYANSAYGGWLGAYNHWLAVSWW